MSARRLPAWRVRQLRHQEAAREFSDFDAVHGNTANDEPEPEPTTTGLLGNDAKHFCLAGPCRRAAGPAAVRYEMEFEERCAHCGELIRVAAMARTPAHAGRR